MIKDGVCITSLGIIFFKSHIQHFSLDDGFAQVWLGDGDWVPTLGPLELELSIEIRLKKKNRIKIL